MSAREDLREAQYDERDIETLDREGGYYCRHVSAMTSERLHSKSDIAAELAWRDAEIDRLKAALLSAAERAERAKAALDDATNLFRKAQDNPRMWAQAVSMNATADGRLRAEGEIAERATAAMLTLVEKAEADRDTARAELQAERERNARDVCWHCGDVLQSPDRPRCHRCPVECDDSECDECGCREETEAMR